MTQKEAWDLVIKNTRLIYYFIKKHPDIKKHEWDDVYQSAVIRAQRLIERHGDAYKNKILEQSVAYYAAKLRKVSYREVLTKEGVIA
ncbi:hypothetical protein [Paenibacillus contaminans]|uniref:Uncharacterized protein n=1 Tax=Paenibacillus contaminans TaxID=450362 RepID=A0A329MRV5_9BACL|nr:hypothetical protein [Paenibacillus contaminans]RAV22665.1 hypothetical protein DQG23_00140 [Paenibacillus contaminans]